MAKLQIIALGHSQETFSPSWHAEKRESRLTPDDNVRSHVRKRRKTTPKCRHRSFGVRYSRLIHETITASTGRGGLCSVAPTQLWNFTACDTGRSRISPNARQQKGHRTANPWVLFDDISFRSFAPEFALGVPRAPSMTAPRYRRRTVGTCAIATRSRRAR